MWIIVDSLEVSFRVEMNGLTDVGDSGLLKIGDPTFWDRFACCLADSWDALGCAITADLGSAQKNVIFSLNINLNYCYFYGSSPDWNPKDSQSPWSPKQIESQTGLWYELLLKVAADSTF